MLVNGNFDAVIMADSAFAERAGTSHQHAASMRQFAVEGFHDTGTCFAHCVGSAREHLRVRAPRVGEIAGVAAVAPGHGLTKALQSGRVPGEPSIQATMRQLARSTANQSLRLLWPTKVQISSNSTASHRLRWTLFRQRRGSDEAVAAYFIYPLGNRICAPHEWRGRYCAASCVQSVTGRFDHVAALCPAPPAENSRDGRTPCTSTWPTRRYGRCAESVHWRTWRNNAACKP